jgi:sialic acid synthase SpsE
MPASVQLGKRVINKDSYPYIIAEIGVNHEGSLELAKSLIEQAKEGGADAAKFQSYKAGSLASKNSPSYWDTSQEATKSQYELFKKYDSFSEKEYIALSDYCKKINIEFISTPFDDNALEFLDPLMSFFKVASADLTNTPFLRKIAGKQKPVVLSTGASTLPEIDEAVHTLEQSGCPSIILLHCILNYPTPIDNAHINMIKGLSRAYPDYIIGYSDHTLPDVSMTPLLSAWLLGAVVLEKHFTHDKSLPGNDHYHSMDKQDLLNFRKIAERSSLLLGPSKHKHPIPTEQISRQNARRSIVIARPVPKDHLLQESDLTYKRPGTGISPLHWDEVIGSKLVCSLEEDHILSWVDLEL